MNEKFIKALMAAKLKEMVKDIKDVIHEQDEELKDGDILNNVDI
jgi:hypothetical protein